MWGKLFEDKISRVKLNQLIGQGFVVLYPKIENEDMPMLYNCADCVVLPSRFLMNTSSDRSPNAALEALACSKVLMASAVGGIPTITRDNAVLIEPNNFKVLASKMDDVLNNFENYSELQLKARQRAVCYLATEHYVKFLLDLIAQYKE
jgi:glycosyltransferase involved in cell wall biosynthesis